MRPDREGPWPGVRIARKRIPGNRLLPLRAKKAIHPAKMAKTSRLHFHYHPQDRAKQQHTTATKPTERQPIKHVIVAGRTTANVSATTAATVAWTRRKPGVRWARESANCSFK